MTFTRSICCVLIAAAILIDVAVDSTQPPIATAAQTKPSALVLFDRRDAVKLKLTEREWNHIPIARELQAGPRIIVTSPLITQSDGVPTIETTSPANLTVMFDDAESRVDMSTLEVRARKGFFSKSLTTMLRPFIHRNALEVSNAIIPPGRFMLEVSIADQAGNRTDETYRLEITPS